MEIIPNSTGETSFAGFLANSFPQQFVFAIQQAISASYEEAFVHMPKPDDRFQYRSNSIPHERNRLVFEHLQELAEDFGLEVTQRRLENGYFFPEIESEEILLHVKHQSSYDPLKEQIKRADYRMQAASANERFGQMSLDPLLFPEEFDTSYYGKCYVVLFFADNDIRKSEVGSVFFVLPSAEGDILTTCTVDEVCSEFKDTQIAQASADADEFDITSKNSDDNEIHEVS